MGYLPSKNFIATVGSALVVIFVGYFVIYVIPAQRPQTAIEAGKPATSFLIAYEDANRDSDGDGLKDWEEILWKTDPQSPDTDGDGTNDSEEIRMERDPLTKGPNDIVPKTEIGASSATSAPATLTGRIAQKFAAEYLTYLGSSEGGLNILRQKSLAESLIESVAGAALTLKDKFSSADIKIIEAASKESREAYLNSAGSFLEKNFAGLEESEVEILNRALNSQNFAGLEKLDLYTKAYQKSVEFLKKERVPAPYAVGHVELMNILNNSAVATADMREVASDPARALAGLEIYTRQLERVPKFFQGINDQIKKDQIDLDGSDGGYYFIKNKQ